MITAAHASNTSHQLPNSQTRNLIEQKLYIIAFHVRSEHERSFPAVPASSAES